MVDKKEKEINEVEKVDEVELVQEPSSKSEEYLALEELFEKYKVKNPRKYEMKKEAFAKQLSELK